MYNYIQILGLKTTLKRRLMDRRLFRNARFMMILVNGMMKFWCLMIN